MYSFNPPVSKLDVQVPRPTRVVVVVVVDVAQQARLHALDWRAPGTVTCSADHD